MSETLTPEQRAETRAMKRLKSEGYAKMPSPEVLQKAIGLEQVRMQAIDKTDTTTIQRAQLAANVLAGYIEVQKEKLEPKAAGYMKMVESTIAFSTKLFAQGVELMENRGKEFEVREEEEDDEIDLVAWDGEGE